MNIKNNPLYRRLNIYLEMEQSMAIIDATDEENREVIHVFLNDVLYSKQTVYIDFKVVSDPCSLAKEIVNQCLDIMSENRKKTMNIDTDMDYSDDYYCLEKALQMPQKISEEISQKIVFICDDFTEILRLKEDKQMEEHMRSVFQHQQDVCFIFRCRSKEELNRIFMDSHAPFFRFAAIINSSME